MKLGSLFRKEYSFIYLAETELLVVEVEHVLGVALM